MRYLKFGVALSVLMFAGCQTGPVSGTKPQLPALKSAPLCENDKASISIEHATANVSECSLSAGSNFQFIIRPENTPINNSAWYGFRVDPKQSGDIRVSMRYEDGKHRYRPKISYDGRSWELIPSERVIKNSDTDVDLRLPAHTRPFLVSAQEAFTKEAHDAWSTNLAARPDVTMSEIGRSVDGNPISLLHVQSDPSKKKPYVMLIGRQHPPEVTGALALLPFTETVLGNSALAQEFRDRFDLLIVPNINPDGVNAGYWRHNKGGVDLNRDWGPFTQPETRAAKSALSRFESGEDRIALFLDFHSTSKNVLYTQTDEEPTSPPMFARDWVAAVDARLDDDVYEFSREPRPLSERAISKNYMYENYGIAAITYEVGDQTDREAIKTGAKVFAEEMMRLLLEHEKKS